MKKQLIFCGVSASALMMINTAIAEGYEVLGFIDNDYHVGYESSGLKIIGRYDDLVSDQPNPINALLETAYFFPSKFYTSGSDYDIMESRIKIADMLDSVGAKVANIISPLSVWTNRDSCTLGKGIYVGPFNYIMDNITFGDYVYVNVHCTLGPGSTYKRNVYVGPHCFVGDFSDLGENIVLTVNVSITGSVISCKRIKIGPNSIVGVGMCISEDIPEKSLVLPGSKMFRKVYNRFSYIEDNLAK